MLDDVVGLIMVHVISELGGNAAFKAVTVLRPIGVSIAFLLALLFTCRFVAEPLTKIVLRWRTQKANPRLLTVIHSPGFGLATQTTVRIAMLTGASYTGTSSLFASYLAGASVSWWDAEVALLDEPNMTVKESTTRHGEGPNMSLEADIQPSGQQRTLAFQSGET